MYLTLNNIVTLKSRFGVIQGHWNGTIGKLGYGFIFAFHSNYGSNLHHFGEKSDLFVENRYFLYPLALDITVRGSPLEYCHTVCHGKLEWLGCLWVKK